MSASFILSPTPGSIPIICFRGPIFRICFIWSRRSVMSKLFSFNLSDSFLEFSSSKVDCALSIRVSISPMPKIRDAILSGWNCSKSPSFSPVPTNLIGLPVTASTDSAAPPLVSESSLDISTLFIPSASSNAFATFTAS